MKKILIPLAIMIALHFSLTGCYNRRVMEGEVLPLEIRWQIFLSHFQKKTIYTVESDPSKENWILFAAASDSNKGGNLERFTNPDGKDFYTSSEENITRSFIEKVELRNDPYNPDVPQMVFYFTTDGRRLLSELTYPGNHDYMLLIYRGEILIDMRIMGHITGGEAALTGIKIEDEDFWLEEWTAAGNPSSGSNNG